MIEDFQLDYYVDSYAVAIAIKPLYITLLL